MTRILVVEDEPLLLDWVAQVLLRKGFDVKSAKAGNDGLALLRAEKFDVLILDLLMPQMSGFEVLSAMEEKGIRVPTIITSGIVIPGVHDYLKTHARVRLLGKPYSEKQLLELIEELQEEPD